MKFGVGDYEDFCWSLMDHLVLVEVHSVVSRHIHVGQSESSFSHRFLSNIFSIE